MSVENLKKFGKMCAEDETVRTKAKAIGLNDPEGLITYAQKELELDFTIDDMRELAGEGGISSDELSEEDLEKIAGGITTVTLLSAALIVGGAVAGFAAGFVVGGAIQATASDAW